MMQIPGLESDLSGPQLDIEIFRGAIEALEGNRLLGEIMADTSWRQEEISLFGKRMPVPRMSAWVGDPGCTYTYSGIAMEPLPWSGPLRAVRRLVTELSGAEYNSVLVNRYRNGDDGVGWHADDEPELGFEPTIASVSLGATRSFAFRRRDDSSVRAATELHHGDIIVMKGKTQALWLHQVPKTRRPVGERINLTFRLLEA